MEVHPASVSPAPRLSAQNIDSQSQDFGLVASEVVSSPVLCEDAVGTTTQEDEAGPWESWQFGALQSSTF